MQSLIHGNFDGEARKKVYALVGASAAIAAAVGPLLGGFITTYRSWRVGFGLEVAIIAQLEGLGDEPQDIQDEIVRINTEARPLALQVALLVPILASLIGFANAFRMARLPDPTPSEAAEMVVGG